MESASERKLLQESLARLLKDKCAPERVRVFLKSGEADAALWKELGEMGFLGLLNPPDLGGMGGSAADLLAVQTEMGRRLVPLPYLQHVAAAWLLTQAGGTKPFGEILQKAGRGEMKLSLPISAGSLTWCDAPSRESDGLLLPYGPAVDGVVVGTPARGKVDIRVIPTGAKGVSLKKVESIDLTYPMFKLNLPAKTPEESVCATVPKNRWAQVKAAVEELTAGAVCAEMLGGAEETLRLTIEYTKARVQFDRPIGSFQAVQHKAADAGILLEGIRSYVARLSVLLGSKASEARRAVQMAKAYVSDAYLKIVETGLQLHGGIGYTWEHDIHLYLRHARRCGASHGDSGGLRELHVQAIR